MEFVITPLPGFLVILPKVFTDNRGYFLETYQQTDFLKLNLSQGFVQDNQSYSHQGVLRGMHFQFPHPQGKLIRAINGLVFNVAIDIRKNSETFGKWFGITLSAKNKKMVWIPEGFANGFYVLSKNATVVYKTTDYYYPQFQHTIKWDDPKISISWPLLNNKKPLVSENDISGLNWDQILGIL